MIDSKAEFLYDCQVPANSVQPVYRQTCRDQHQVISICKLTLKSE